MLFRSLIKKRQAILKRFIDLRFSVWFTLRSENETTFCDTSNFFQIDGRPRFSKLSNLLAESLRTFLDKSGKRKEERGKRKKVLGATKHGFVF